MILIGLVLVVAGAVFGLDLLWKNHFRVPDPLIFGQSLGISGSRWLFVLGLLTGAAVALGVVLVLSGTRRRASKARSGHQQRKTLEATRSERDALRAENEGLRTDVEPTARGESGPAGI